MIWAASLGMTCYNPPGSDRPARADPQTRGDQAPDKKKSMTVSQGSESSLEPKQHRHLVQFYDGDLRPLARNVSRYVAEGLAQGHAAIVIAVPEHAAAFVAQLATAGIDSAAELRHGRLVVLDAQETLAQFMVDGLPDAARFDQTVGAMVRELHVAHPGLRTYGEMVGVLWETGYFTAAIRLEELWNALLSARDFELFCAYPIDVLSDDFQTAEVDAVMCAHTNVVASTSALERALDRAIGDVLGTNAAALQTLMTSHYWPAWATLPRAEAMILWLRSNAPNHADAILARAREYSHLAA